MLARDISTTNLLIVSAGGIIGSGWLLGPFLAAKMAGPNALISWVIAAAFMLLIALPLCELGTMLPFSGGMSNYPTYTHGKEVGFLFSWITWLAYVVMTPIETQAILQYGSHFFPQLVVKEVSYFKLSDIGYIAALVLMFIVVMLNTYGIKFLSECSKYASIIKFVIPSIAIVSLIHASPSFGNIHFVLNTKQSWMQIFTALSAAGLAFDFTGFQNGLMLAGEVKNPQKVIPITMLGAILIALVLYFTLQLAFLVAMPADPYLQHGWHQLAFPGESGPLVGIALLLGLGWVATLILFDAAFSPFSTSLVYTAATSRILYGMALNEHLPKIFLKVNKHKTPYITLVVNFLVGALVFFLFPEWPKMLVFLSAASIFSYGIGPICLLGLRKLRAEQYRPFRLSGSLFFCHLAFFVCNLILYWCGFESIWKLCLAILIGLIIYFCSQQNKHAYNKQSVGWFFSYLSVLLLFSYLGSFGGIGLLKFPFDTVLMFPLSFIMLYFSQHCLVKDALEVESMELINKQLRDS